MSKVQFDDGDTEFVKSLAKGLAVIEAFEQDSPSLTLSRVAEKVGLSPGSARRVLVTLTKLGYLRYDEVDKRYQLAPRTLQLGYSYLASLPALSLLQPRLSELSDRLNESCSIMVRDGKEVVCVARATARRLQRDYMSVGTRFPAHASSSGKILLGGLSAYEFDELFPEDGPLPQVTPFTVKTVACLREQVAAGRAQGWAFIDQETALGLASVAVPLRMNGRILYGLSTSAPPTYEGSSFVERYLPELLNASEAMEQLLAARA